MYVRGDTSDTMDVMANDMENCTIVDGSITMLFVNNAVEDKKKAEEDMKR